MPLPNIPGRIAYMAETRPLPPSPRGKLELAYIEHENMHFAESEHLQEVDEVCCVKLTQVRLDRTFEYWIHPDHVRAIFIPKNSIYPNLEDGDWYFGSEKVRKYVEANVHGTDTVVGIVYVCNDASIRWRVDGSSSMRDMREVVRPLFAPKEFSPIEFQGLFDSSDICCDHE